MKKAENTTTKDTEDANISLLHKKRKLMPTIVSGSGF